MHHAQEISEWLCGFDSFEIRKCDVTVRSQVGKVVVFQANLTTFGTFGKPHDGLDLYTGVSLLPFNLMAALFEFDLLQLSC